MRQGPIVAAAIAGAAALIPVPAKAVDGLTIFAAAAAGVILSGPAVSAAYGYSSPASYGPRYGYAYYGSYGRYAGPAYPAERLHAESYASYGYGSYYRYPPYALAAYPLYDGPGCYWTKRPGYYGRRAVRVCY